MEDSWLTSGEATVFVLPKVKKSFDESLQDLVKDETGSELKPIRLSKEFSEWVALRAGGKRWAKGRRTPAEKALSRAFQALAAARYHLRGDAEVEAELRALRDRVEALWMARNGNGKD